MKLANIMLLAVWAGLVTGFGEISLLAIKKYFLHRFIPVSLSMSEDFFWMAPVADFCIFGFIGLILYLAAQRRPVKPWLKICISIFASLGFLSLFSYVGSLHFYGRLLLAVGLAVATARVIGAQPRRFELLVRRTTVWLVVLAVGPALGIHGWQNLVERRALVELPSAPSNAPNVLMIVLDTVRAQNLSLYGYARQTTPQIMRLAKTSIVFNQAVSTSPWTLPSHASLFTGRYPHEVSADWQTPLDGTYPTLAETLRTRGYMTAGFVGNFYYGSYQYGLDRGFVHYEDHPVSIEMMIKSSWLGRTIMGLRTLVGNHQDLVRKTAEDINQSFLRWLAYNDKRPFFVFLNYYDAHAPYLAPTPFNRQYASGGSLYWLPSSSYDYSPKEIHELLSNYDGAIAYVDHQLGLLLDELENRGLLNNTLVIITSDHGEEFREHGVMEHGNSVYLSSLHVPLLVRFPSRIPAGQRVAGPVSLRDVPVTVIDLLDIETDHSFPGNSLARHWNGSGRQGKPITQAVLSEVSRGIRTPGRYPVSRGPMKSLMEQQFHYIRNGDGREELYNIERDSLQQHDLAGIPKNGPLLKHFRDLLAQALKGDGT